MKFTPRDYQASAVAAGVEWIKKSTDPACITAPTGAGKALLCAMLAEEYLALCGNSRKVLILAPSATLVKQNYRTYLDYSGKPASMFSASAGEKCMKHRIIIGTPQSIKNQVGRFDGVGCVIIDESHETTPSIKHIIERLRDKNKHLRILGLTATPFRLGQGYIYRHHFMRGAVPADQCSDDSYYHSCIYEISARYLIEKGYLTPPIFDHSEIHYDTSGLTINRMGNFDASSIDAAFVGKGRLTSQIVADVVEKAKGRNCVLWFASTIQHAHEIAESLPPSITRVVTGDMPKKELAQVLADFQSGKLRHVVNVAMLHRGFDAPNIDTIAVLRATESAALYLQIIGRGLRLFEGKKECLILDYAENVERHAPNGDIFEPDIKAFKSGGGSGEIEVVCPLCNKLNLFSARPNEEGYLLTPDGYFSDLAGQPITNESDIPIPSHFGRRCTNEALVKGQHVRCTYRWSPKQCPECGHENDIAARYCEKCKAEIVDPNQKLREIEAKIASDPYRLRIEPVQSIQLRRWPGREGKPDTLRVDYNIESAPHQVSEWYSPNADNAWMVNRWRHFAARAWPDGGVDTLDDAISRKGEARCPQEIAYRKKPSSKFFEVSNVSF